MGNVEHQPGLRQTENCLKVAGQTLFTRAILSSVALAQKGGEMPGVSDLIVDAVRAILKDETADRSLRAYALALPSLGTSGESMEVIDPQTTLQEPCGTKMPHRHFRLSG